MKLVALLLAVPLSVNAWEKLPGYPDSVYALQGELVETTGSFKNNIELVHSPKRDLYGITFYNYVDKGDLAFIPNGTVTMRGCGFKVYGLIENQRLALTPKSKEYFKKLTCGSPIFVRIYDGFENYATYRIENIPEIKS